MPKKTVKQIPKPRKLTWPESKVSAEADQEQWFEDLIEADTLENAKFSMAYAFLRKWNVDWDTAMLIIEDTFRSRTNPKKLKPIEQLRLIESGRSKANSPEEEGKARRREAHLFLVWLQYGK